MTLTANKIIVTSVVMLVAAITLIVLFAPKSVWNPVCYNGHRYNVDQQGVMWPVQMKYGVQKCQPGDPDVSTGR